MQGTNAYPSRSYPEWPAVPTPDPALGGARGPAALPSRILTHVLPAGPPSAPPFAGKGPIAQRQRSGAVVEMDKYSPGRQNLGQDDNVVFHDTIAWSRPFFPNTGPVAQFSNPTQMPSWTANQAIEAGIPTTPIPHSKHRIDSFTVNEEFGSTRQLFPLWGTRRPLSGMSVQGQRWAAQAKTMNPYMPKLTSYGLAGSYGQTTKTLQTQPINSAGNATGFGAY